MKVEKAVIPAAGFGTRFLPFTKAMPKEMLPIIDKPTIHFVVEEAVNSGIDDILIITGKGKHSIENYFDRNSELEAFLEKKGKAHQIQPLRDIEEMAHIHYIRQKEQKGLAHAISCAEKHVSGEPFAVLLGDNIIHGEPPCTRQLVDEHLRTGKTVVAVEEKPGDQLHRYGVVDGTPLGERSLLVTGVVEKPPPGTAPSNLVSNGRYVFSPEIFDCIRNAPAGAGGEYQITDAMKPLVEKREVVAYKYAGERWYDTGDKVAYVIANIEFALRHDEHREELSEYLRELAKRL
ncbi:MAG: UTP--glucose-1-phosphate uridylyltransferase GalU [Candidatus Diapherotrites archaeon]|nr:UTP--glucose-1-phosphate uridylyltransferase GalU [Candidatus Diapherotrites archaeon]